MRDTIKQIVLVVLALMLAIPVANWVLEGMKSETGVTGSPLVLCEEPFVAGVRILVGMIWFGVLAFVVGRLSHRYTGALVFGLGWTLVARQGMNVSELYFILDSLNISESATHWKFLVESLLYSIPSAAIVFVLAKYTGTRYTGEHGRYTQTTIRGTVIACVIGLIACWMFVRTDFKGQAVFGVLTGCALASTVVRLVWPHCNGSTLYVVPVFVAVVASISSAIIMGGSSINQLVTDDIWALARPMPLDFIGPGVFGIALGIGIARTFGQDDEILDAKRDEEHGDQISAVSRSA